MTMIPDEVVDNRLLTPAELGAFVKTWREQNKWSQATLAELSGLSERTIQRVENGEPSDLDTRCAIARAFQFEDIDAFNKPWPVPNVEKLESYAADLERTTVLIPLTKISDGRTLRSLVEGTSSYTTEEIGDNSADAREAFAAIVDYLSDYNDIHEEFSMSQRLNVDRDIDDYLKMVTEQGSVVAAGLRKAKIRFKGDQPGLDPVDWTNIYFVLAPQGVMPSSIRVPKKFQLG